MGAIGRLVAWLMLLMNLQVCSASADGFFVYSAEQVSHSSNPKLFVRVGEKLPAAALKRRFNSYKVTMTAGEDCVICGMVVGPSGSFQVYWDGTATKILSVLSSDKTSSDSFGNLVGSSLRNAIGSSASCTAGDFTICEAKMLRPSYVPSHSEHCKVQVPQSEKVETIIASCVTIENFIIGRPY
jgi:hypothetical protein